jgi:hypothetical protein
MNATMNSDVVEVRALPNRRIWVRFQDGVSGEIDVRKLVTFDGVFAPLADERFFRSVRVHDETRTVCWPNDADLDSDVLHALVTGRSLPG